MGVGSSRVTGARNRQGLSRQWQRKLQAGLGSPSGGTVQSARKGQSVILRVECWCMPMPDVGDADWVEAHAAAL